MSIFRKKPSQEEIDQKFREDFDKYVEGPVTSGNMRLVFQNDITEVYSILDTFYMAFLKTQARSNTGNVIGTVVGPDDFKGLNSGDSKFFMYLMNRNERSNIPTYQVDENFAGQILQIARKARTKGQKVDLTLEDKTLSDLGLKWYTNEEEEDDSWKKIK